MGRRGEEGEGGGRSGEEEGGVERRGEGRGGVRRGEGGGKEVEMKTIIFVQYRCRCMSCKYH